MTMTGVRKAGEFCWINILTPKPDEARAFFGQVLGWTYTEIPGMGHTIEVDGKSIGGLFDLAGPNTPPGTPPTIGVMVKVAGADATVGKVNELGGKGMPAFDIMDNGRMAVCFDPNGAGFDLWEPKKKPGTEADGRRHGAPSWFELMTTDVDRAVTFYTKLFGWIPEVKPMPGMMYTTFRVGDDFIAGMMPITPQMGRLRTQWVTYFTVSDTDAAIRRSVELGGKVTLPAQDVPGVGRFAGIASPQGLVFHVFTYAG